MSQGFTKGVPIDTDPTMALNSNQVVPSQAAVVSYIGTKTCQTLTGDTGGSLLPSTGNFNILGSSGAAGTNPVRSSGTASTLTIGVQKSQAIASTDATKVGLCNFNSSQFSVDANGFVALAGGSATTIVTTYTSGTGTWTINAATVWVESYLWGGGGGGGSGRFGNDNAASGGGGGGGGQFTYVCGPASAFASGLSYTVGASGAGGVAQASFADGLNGVVGGNTILGNIVSLGGNFGSGGTSSSGAAGASRQSRGTVFSSTNNSIGAGSAGSAGDASTAAASAGDIWPFGLTTGGGGGGGAHTSANRTGANGGGLLNGAGATLVAGAAGGINTGTINGAAGEIGRAHV